MILDRLDVTPPELERATGWKLTPEGACKGDRCVPLPGIEADRQGRIDAAAIAERLGMPVAHDAGHQLWALGPEAAGAVLDTARMPELVLPDFEGAMFDVGRRGDRKVLLLAWASW